MKKIFFTTILLALSIGMQAQHFKHSNNYNANSVQNYRNYGSEERRGLRSYPMEIGGNIGMSFGSNTSIVVCPTLGWQFSKYIAAGVGLNYMYHKYDILYDYKEQYFGAGVYARARIFDYIALYARPELNYASGSYRDEYDHKQNLDNKLVPSVILGAGIYIPAGPGAIIVSAYYDVVQNNRSPYGDQIGTSVGYLFSF